MGPRNSRNSRFYKFWGDIQDILYIEFLKPRYLSPREFTKIQVFTGCFKNTDFFGYLWFFGIFEAKRVTLLREFCKIYENNIKPEKSSEQGVPSWLKFQACGYHQKNRHLNYLHFQWGPPECTKTMGVMTLEILNHDWLGMRPTRPVFTMIQAVRCGPGI